MDLQGIPGADQPMNMEHDTSFSKSPKEDETYGSWMLVKKLARRRNSRMENQSRGTTDACPGPVVKMDIAQATEVSSLVVDNTKQNEEHILVNPNMEAAAQSTANQGQASVSWLRALGDSDLNEECTIKEAKKYKIW